MKKQVLVISLLMFASTMGLGCLDSPPSPPASKLPKIVVDLYKSPDTGNNSIIYIHGLEEVRYTNITLKLNDETVVQRNETFSVEYHTNLTEFEIYSEIHDDEDGYYFNSAFTVSEKEELAYRVVDEEGDSEKIKKEDLPYVERFQQMEENR